MSIFLMTLSALAKNSVNGTSPILLSEDVYCKCVNFQAELVLSTMDSLFVKCGHFLLMVN